MQAMQGTCPVPNHASKALMFICTNPQCEGSRLLCFTCLNTQHQQCLNYILEVDDIYKRSLSANVKWVKDDEVRQAIVLTQYQDSATLKESTLHGLEEFVETEFNKINEYFFEKMREAKKKTIDHIQSKIISENINIKEFEEQLKGLYNFDALVAILESFRTGEKGLDIIDIELKSFFKEINSSLNMSKELYEVANKISSLAQEIRNFNQVNLEKFKDSIPFEILKVDRDGQILKIQEETWTWDALKKSNEIGLQNNNTVAAKTAYYSKDRRAVLGSVELSSHQHRWEIDFSDSSPHMPCFVNWLKNYTVFGITETLFNNVENPSLDSIIGIDLNGKYFNMDEGAKSGNVKTKKYVCELDLNKGVFCIYNDGKMLCRKNTGIKSKKFYPILVLYCVHDKAKLRIL